MAAAAVIQSLLVLIFLLLGCLCGFSDAEERSVGGYPIDISRVPYQVYLRRNGAFACGGTLITNRMVLTAAHCVHKMHAREFDVVGGSTYINRGGVKSLVTSIVIPRDYDENTKHMDVAILRLEVPLVGPNIKTIPRCRAPVPADVKVLISGWGAIRFGGSISYELRAVDLPVVSADRCQRVMSGRYALTNTMLCVGDRTTRSSCNGDSGGPLVYNGQVCGVVSWGVDCSTRYVPAVFTDVYQVRSFIDTTLKQYS